MTDNFDNFREKFIYYFDKYDIKYSEKIIQNFYCFTEYLLTENEKYNLTSIKDPDEIIIKHYIDSLMPLKYFEIPENAKIIDIGCGAGFPSLPLAIMRPDLQITFLDSSNKKINFIKNAISPLLKGGGGGAGGGLHNFLCGRAEESGKNINLRESYDFAVSRAVARLNILCELAAPFINPGGYFIAYKSRAAPDEIAESENAFKTLDLKTEEIIEFDLYVGRAAPGAPRDPLLDKPPPSADGTPFQKGAEKRFLIKIKKIKKTSSKYPRNFSNITKNPL